MKYSLSQFEDTGLATSRKPGHNPLTLAALVCLWIASLGNIALWQELAKLSRLSTLSDWGLAGCLLVVTWALLMLFSSFAAWRRLVKPWLIFLLFAAAMGAHFMTSYRVVIDPSMILNTLHTDVRETRDLLNWRMLATVAVLAALPSLWLWRTPVQSLRLGRQAALNAISLVANFIVFTAAIGLFYQGFAALMRTHEHVRYLLNPLNSLYSTAHVATASWRASKLPLQAIGLDATVSRPAGMPAPTPVLVLVVGETARAANFSLGGYSRQTNPKLAELAQKEAFSYWRNAWSCGTNTAASVPCMFSHLGKEAFEGTKQPYESLLDVLQRAGLAVLWLDNQGGCKGVCDRVPHIHHQYEKSAQTAAHCATGECFDMVMLHQLQERIATLSEQQRKKGTVIVLHQMGSHGPAYSKRVPPEFQTFTPICSTSDLAQCSREHITNSYDNTIAYTDHFLSETIKTLKAAENTRLSAMFFVSDHGESLGENGIYLHSLPYAIAPKEQKHIPWLNWFSAGWVAQRKLDMNCLKAKADERISHDNLFHAVLGLMQVQTSLYKPQLDLYSTCMSR